MDEFSIPKKTLGQHWLDDELSLESICLAADVGQGDVVLEIGPGLGSLTDKLLENGAEVLALELDEELIARLEKKYAHFPSSKIKITPGDIRTYDYGNMPDKYKIVANLPYYLTSFLLRRLTEPQTHKPQIAALLVQKEVAQRVAAKPGDMSVIAVAAQFYYEVSLADEVPAELFTPPPKVDSQILVLKLRSSPLFEADTKKFFQIVKAGFSQKRKTLENSLSGGLGTSKQQARQILESAGISPNNRAQALTMEDWQKLYEAKP